MTRCLFNNLFNYLRLFSWSKMSSKENRRTLPNFAVFFPTSTLVPPSARANMASMLITSRWATFFLLSATDPLLLSRKKLQRTFLKLRELIGTVKISFENRTVALFWPIKSLSGFILEDVMFTGIFREIAQDKDIKMVTGMAQHFASSKETNLNKQLQMVRHTVSSRG